MGDEGIDMIMLTIQTQKYMAIIFTVMLICSSCTNAQTFIITDIVFPDNIPEKYVQEVREKIIRTEVYLLFSYNDVRMTVKTKGEKAESMVLQKIGDNLYRAEDGGEVFDLELNTVFNYIKSCKITIYDKKKYSSSMVWNETITLKRK